MPPIDINPIFDDLLRYVQYTKKGKAREKVPKQEIQLIVDDLEAALLSGKNKQPAERKNEDPKFFLDTLRFVSLSAVGPKGIATICDYIVILKDLFSKFYFFFLVLNYVIHGCLQFSNKI